MTPVTAVTTVVKCPCGSYILSAEGLENHFSTCSKLQEKVTLSAISTSRNDASSIVDSCVALVDFYSPEISLDRLSTVQVSEVIHRAKPKSESCNETKIEPICQDKIDDWKEIKHEVRNQSSKRLPFIAPLPPRRSNLRAVQKLREICEILKENPTACSTGKSESKDEIEFLVEESDEDAEESEEYEIAKHVERTRKRKRARRTNCLVADDHYVHKCNVCPSKFKSETKLKWHMFNIHGDGSQQNEIITCPLCARMINKRLVFLSHLKSHENAEALEEAFDLWNKWPEKIRKGSKTAKMSLTFSCKYCLIPHKSHYSFLTHMELEHPEKGRFSKYVCTYCRTSEFDSMKLFLLHIRTTHPKEYYGETIKWTLSDPLKQEGRPKGQCDICKKMLDVFYLRAHKEKVHSSRHKSKSNHSQNQEKGTLLDSNNFYNCPISDCYTKVKNKAMLKCHFILHLQNNPFACPVPGCNVKCDAQCHLNRHMKLHTSQLDHTCNKCGVSYSRIDKLRNHVCCFDKSRLKLENGRIRPIKAHSRLQRVQISDQWKKYSNIKKSVNINAIFDSDPVFIKVCKDYPSFRELILGRNDIKIRDAPRKYKCTNCFTTFHERKILEKHSSLCKVKEVSGKIEETWASAENEIADCSMTTDTEKVGCPICAESFENSTFLENHVQSVHEPSEIFRCSACKSIFSTKRIKERHMQLCHKRLPFKCQRCVRRFSTRNLFGKHEEEGHCEAKTTCSKCGKILACSQSLARHWLLIHKVKVQSAAPKTGPLRIKKPTKPKRKSRRSESLCVNNIQINIRRRRGENVHERRNVDYSIVKIETEPELNIYDCDTKINSEQVIENIIKIEPSE